MDEVLGKAARAWRELATRARRGRDCLRSSLRQVQRGMGRPPATDRGTKQCVRRVPYAIYASPGMPVRFESLTTCEIAGCSAPSQGNFVSRLITPKDVAVSLRGGGNASRQIVDVMPPSFPADRLIVVEVYTPGGNWSSYPPHKHDVHNPPAEVDLDEIYYYRMNRPGAFAHQRLYSSDKQQDSVVTVHDGDAVLVHEGYHPVVAGPGYDTYYLNFIAGSARSLAITEDPMHTWIRSSWKEVDRRLPLVR
jgi:5-deoxy-glucuronate isomerase